MKHTVVLYFVIIFYLLAVYSFINGMWLFQLQPSLYLTRFDGFTWVFMQTGIHQWLLNNPAGWMVFDTLFYSLPLIYFLSHNVFRVGSTVFALLMLIVNWVYVQCYTLYPSNSIEAHIAWLLFPVAFLATNPAVFRLLLGGLRYFFLYVFISAAVWKISTGAVFNTNQMSAILLYQHADLLYSTPHHWQSDFIAWLIKHPGAGYAVYLLAIVLELFFVAGFFTKRFDRLLIVLALVFLVADLLVMRIPYFSLLPFLLTLTYRKNEAEYLPELRTA